jgi:hypothetical protein
LNTFDAAAATCPRTPADPNITSLLILAEVRYYSSLCLKIFGGEHGSNSKKLGGFNDRTFNTEVTKGKPKQLVKEIKKQVIWLKKARDII